MKLKVIVNRNQLLFKVIGPRSGQLYTTVILPGRLTVVYIYRRNEFQTTIFIMPRKGSFPGKRVFLGGLYFRENGARKAFGEVS